VQGENYQERLKIEKKLSEELRELIHSIKLNKNLKEPDSEFI